MSRKVRWGVIGSGGIARRRTIPEGIMKADNAELVAVYDVDTRVNTEVAKSFGVHAASSIDELLESGIDTVYLATPAYLHAEQAIECAEASKHILCEKPLGMNPAETARMRKACAENGVKLGIGFMMRFQSQHQAALSLIREGKLGKPVYGRAQLSCWYPPIPGSWRQDPEKGGGGSLIDMGGHCIDLLTMFFGPVERVSCFINNTIHPYRSEDSAVALLSFANGAMASVDTFFCIQDASSLNALELYGSKGSVLATNTIGQGDRGEMTAYLEGGDAGYAAQQNREIGGGIRISPEPRNTYRSEIEEWSSAILESRISALDSRIGVENQKILDACYLSARSGKSVDIV
ncbi:MAG TPA: Gfo/Idh/MocA family oxidoreductase [Spirochaetia bacterium]|nr:Gfo/Idh/MocA family oxidoreductase [Spirochaetia bacterium]